jgi:hypothetical protein
MKPLQPAPALADDIVFEPIDGEKKFDPNQPRDDQGRWTDTPGGDTHIFASPAHEGDSPDFQRFEMQEFESYMNKEAAKLGVEIESYERVEGIWSQTPELSLAIDAEGPDADRLGARLGRRFNQEAVLSFRLDDAGPDREWVFVGAGEGQDSEAILKAAEEHGLFGATRVGDDLVVVAGPNVGGEDEDALLAFGDQLGASEVVRYPGKARLIEREEYDEVDSEGH